MGFGGGPRTGFSPRACIPRVLCARQTVLQQHSGNETLRIEANELEQNLNGKAHMKIAVLGTGMVGNAIATKLVDVGHQVTMGSRTGNSDAGQEWLRGVSGKGSIGTFADAAALGEIILDCTNGANSIAALRSAGTANLRGKILIQVGNPLDFSKGMPPTLTICNTDSLGEQTQRE